MPTSTDFETLFSLQGIWVKIRSDILSHLIVGVVIFVLFDISFPKLFASDLTATLLVTDETFIALKESGLIVYLPLLMIGLLFVYGLIIHSLGRFLVSIQTVLFPPKFDSRQIVYSLSDSTIEAIIRSMGTVHCRHDRIIERATNLLLKYRNLNGSEFKSFFTSLKEQSQNSLVQYGNLSVFLVLWILLPFVLPDENSWWKQNQNQHLPVALFLLFYCLWSRWRATIYYRQTIPRVYSFVALMIQQDDHMKTAFQQTEDSLEEIRNSIREMREEGLPPSRPPSIFLYCREKLRNIELLRRQPRSKIGWPLPQVYRKGAELDRISRNDGIQEYDNEWLLAYCAYCYYLIHNWFTRLPKLIWALCKFIVSGDTTLR